MRAARIPYSIEELAFVEARHALPRQSIHAAFVAAFQRAEVSIDAIKALCTRNGWTRREPFTPTEDEVLEQRYANTPTATLAAELGRPISGVYQRAARLGFAKSETYLASEAAGRLRVGSTVGAAHRFSKGLVPANKGVKRPAGWAPGRMREAQFEPGQAGWNWKPIGSERIIAGYRYTKISDTRKVPWTVNWKATHIIAWEAVHGPVPERHALKTVDGDRLNADPTNWQCVPRAILPRLNGGRHGRLGYDEAPAEFKPTIMAVARLDHAFRTRKRKASA